MLKNVFARYKSLNAANGQGRVPLRGATQISAQARGNAGGTLTLYIVGYTV